MPPPIPVVLADYHSDWPLIAAGHVERLQVLGSTLLAVHHIGSTAVPGLAAKPVIDLMPVVENLAELDSRQTMVEALGYVWHGELGIPGRRYCTLSGEEGTRLVQLHCFEASSPHVTRHLAFRDYLRTHPGAMQEYENEKRRAWQLHPADSHAYGAEKAAWIQKTEQIALAWFAGQGKSL